MKQQSFASLAFAAKKKVTRREKFLAEMERLVPWNKLLAALQPFYPDGQRGRPPIDLGLMLRLYFIQQWYALADEALEDALYDSHALQVFVGIDLGHDAVPDATTILKFRRRLETYNLTRTILKEINEHLSQQGLLMRQGTIVDATIIAAPSSTKNATGKRDPEMHQTKKGNQWHHGMKAHIGVDVHSGLVHTVIGTAANEADINQTHALLHGQEQIVYADAGYTGIEQREEVKSHSVEWNIALRHGKRRQQKTAPYGDLLERLEVVKARIRARVEHPFHIIKNLFKHKKVRYRGIKKNTDQLFTLFALANLCIAKRQLQGRCV